MKKRALAILMAALTASTMFAVPTFAADYSGEDPQLEKNIKILTIWAEDNDNGMLLNKICEDYQKNVNPNFTWEYEMVASDNLQQKIATLAASNDLPDLFAYEAGAPLSVLIDSGKVKNITEAVDEIGTAAYYVPAFWLGVVLILIFSVNLGWFPSSGAYDVGMADSIGNRMKHMILPLVVMIFSHLWYYAYMIRNKFLDEVRKDYVLLARSKGLSKRMILWKHCLRNVMPTIVSIMAVSVPHVTGGTVTVEAVFNYAGIGNLAVESAKYHDYNLLMIDVMITGFIVFLSSFVAQTVNEEIDPRMKDSEVRVW